jgi:hypothetical protein
MVATTALRYSSICLVCWAMSLERARSEEIDRDYIADWSKRLGLSEEWQAVLLRVGQGLP